MRGLAAAVLLLAAAPLFAVDTGRAEGEAVVNGKTVRFKYAYAYTSGEQSVTVLVTDRPLRARDDPRKPVRWRVQSMRIAVHTDGTTEVRQIVIQNTNGTFVIDNPEVGMAVNVDEDAIDGTISMATSIRIRIAFNAVYSK